MSGFCGARAHGHCWEVWVRLGILEGAMRLLLMRNLGVEWKRESFVLAVCRGPRGRSDGSRMER